MLNPTARQAQRAETQGYMPATYHAVPQVSAGYLAQLQEDMAKRNYIPPPEYVPTIAQKKGGSQAMQHVLNQDRTLAHIQHKLAPLYEKPNKLAFDGSTVAEAYTGGKAEAAANKQKQVTAQSKAAFDHPRAHIINQATPARSSMTPIMPHATAAARGAAHTAAAANKVFSHETPADFLGKQDPRPGRHLQSRAQRTLGHTQAFLGAEQVVVAGTEGPQQMTYAQHQRQVNAGLNAANSVAIAHPAPRTPPGAARVPARHQQLAALREANKLIHPKSPPRAVQGLPGTRAVPYQMRSNIAFDAGANTGANSNHMPVKNNPNFFKFGKYERGW